MRLLTLAAAVAALLVPAAPAFAGDPTMPLWQVQAGMRCTGYSVIQGTTISSFDVEVLDVAGGEATGGGDGSCSRCPGRRWTRPGSGPGFSGSPIYCPDGAGVSRVIGAISRVDQRVRRQGRAGDADRGDHRHAGRRARRGRRAATRDGDGARAAKRLSPRMKAALASAQADRRADDA